MLPIVMILVVVVGMTGAIRFNRIKQKWAGVIGVGGAWLSAMGMMGIIMAIGGLISGAVENEAPDIGTILVYFVMGVLFSIPFIKAELRCTTVKQKVSLPLICFALSFGFVYRVFWSLITRTPINIPVEEDIPQGSGHNVGYLPNTATDQYGKKYRLQSVSGDYGRYVSDDGDSVELHKNAINSGRFER